VQFARGSETVHKNLMKSINIYENILKLFQIKEGMFWVYPEHKLCESREASY
jgi:hypothetical protein